MPLPRPCLVVHNALLVLTLPCPATHRVRESHHYTGNTLHRVDQHPSRRLVANKSAIYTRLNLVASRVMEV